VLPSSQGGVQQPGDGELGVCGVVCSRCRWCLAGVRGVGWFITPSGQLAGYGRTSPVS
jgi:hypothetical protein